jgi:hypothetical protein
MNSPVETDIQVAFARNARTAHRVKVPITELERWLLGSFGVRDLHIHKVELLHLVRDVVVMQSALRLKSFTFGWQIKINGEGVDLPGKPYYPAALVSAMEVWPMFTTLGVSVMPGADGLMRTVKVDNDDDQQFFVNSPGFVDWSNTALVWRLN